jgi:predicted nucleic acid-binding protein
MSGFLLDTNVISGLIKPKPEASVVKWVDSTDENLLFLSVLTLGEIRKGIAGLAQRARRGALESWLETSLRPRFAGRILSVDQAVGDRWGVITAAAAAAGTPVPVIDGLLAATALHHHLTLVTRNAADVVRTGALVLNPFVPDASRNLTA